MRTNEKVGMLERERRRRRALRERGEPDPVDVAAKRRLDALHDADVGDRTDQTKKEEG